MTTSVSERVLRAIKQVDFPASKEDIVATARREGADEDALRSLRAIPPVDYRNKDEILASIDVDPKEGTAGDNPGLNRVHTHPGLAQHEKDH